MKKKIIQQIEFRLSVVNLWWDTTFKPHWRFVITINLVSLIVFGTTSDNIKIQTVSFIFMMGIVSVFQ